MKRNLIRVSALVAMTVVLGLAVAVMAQEKMPAKGRGMAGEHMGGMHGGTPLMGTWKFVSRKLADGTTITPPNIIGLMSFSRDMRNFNIAWTDKAGKRTSLSSISSYTMNDKEYSETMMYSCVNDESGMLNNGTPTNGPQYTMTSQTKSSPITMSGGATTFQMPFDPPQISINGSTMTATAQGRFTDTWEREGGMMMGGMSKTEMNKKQ